MSRDDGWMVLLGLLVVPFGRGRLCALLVSFFCSFFRQFSGRKEGETYLPPLIIPPPRECMRPRPTKQHHPNEEHRAQSELLPRGPLRPIAPSNRSWLLLLGGRIAMRYRERKLRLLLALLTAVARTNPVVMTLAVTEFLVVVFSLSSIRGAARRANILRNESGEKERGFRVVGESQKLGLDCGRAYSSV